MTPLLERAVAAAGAASPQPSPFNDIKRKTLQSIIIETRNHCYAKSVGRSTPSFSWRPPSPPASPPYNPPTSSSPPASPSSTLALTTSRASPKSYKQRAYVLARLGPSSPDHTPPSIHPLLNLIKAFRASPRILPQIRPTLPPRLPNPRNQLPPLPLRITSRPARAAGTSAHRALRTSRRAAILKWGRWTEESVVIAVEGECRW